MKTEVVWTKVTDIEHLLQGETITPEIYIVLRCAGFTDAQIEAHKKKTQ